MPVCIIFDDGRGNLAPLTDLRSAGEIRTGALTTAERLAAMASAVQAECVALYMPEGVAALARERLEPAINSMEKVAKGEDDVLLLNARAVLLPEAALELKRGEALVAHGGDVIAARMKRKETEDFLAAKGNGRPVFEPPKGFKASEFATPCLLEYPWDVIRFRDDALDLDLQLLSQRECQALPEGVVAINDEAVCISPEAMVYPTVVLDASDGPIVIDDHAVVRPGAVICGPAYIGEGSTVIDRALIKKHTSIGPVCKVAGEVGGCIFQSFSNKAHDGHLGDSYVGEWVNLGAGTTNSNLLNTYTEVIAQIPGKTGAMERRRTGLQFLGAIIGDHVKTAICTRIGTGAVIGTGAMIATTAPAEGWIERFAWLTDKRARQFRLEKFIETARAMMARRHEEPSKALLARLKDIYPGGTEAAGTS